MDFVTIFYNNNIDIKLLEIQAYSFNYLDIDVCNKIILFLNSNDELENDYFLKYINDVLINIYPEKFRNRIQFFTKKHCDLECKNTWQSQQLIKLIISKKITTQYYCVLDTKIHFIKNVEIKDFLNPKPNLYINKITHLNHKFIGSLNFFDNQLKIKQIIDTEIFEFSTVPPFIFETEYVKQMIDYIPNFNDFFLLNNKITEFFIYISFIIKINKIDNYNILYKNELSYVFFNHMKSITTEKIIGLHYNFILKSENEIKEIILKIYENTQLYYHIQDILKICDNKFYI